MNRLIAVSFALVVVLSTQAFDCRQVFRTERMTRGNVGLRNVQDIDSAAWIGLEGANYEAGKSYPCSRFRCAFFGRGESLRIDVSADARYVLLLDGKEISRGPHKGFQEHWYYQTYDIDGLGTESHLLEAVVFTLGDAGPRSLMTTGRSGFVLKASGSYDLQLSTGRGKWQVQPVPCMSFGRKTDPHGMAGRENVVRGTGFLDWVGSSWQDPVVLRAPIVDQEYGVHHVSWEMFPTERHDDQVRMCRPGAFCAAQDCFTATNLVYGTDDSASPWVEKMNGLLSGKGPVVLPPHGEFRFLWDLKRYVCAYPVLKVAHGRGGEIRWAWTESLYERHMKGHVFENKGDRRLYVGKRVLYSMFDTFLPDGRESAVFTTPWWKCGRWIELSVRTGDEAVDLTDIFLQETHYPLEVRAVFECDRPSVPRIGDMCLNGLLNCLHESFMDCPYFEQQTYCGDTRIELLVDNALTGDGRLSRHGIGLFDYGRRNNGLVPMNFPSSACQDSSTFSMIWIAMCGDYALWHGADAFLKARVPGMRQTLSLLASSCNSDGLLEDLPGWSFVDWVPEWDKYGNAPEGRRGVSAVNNLLFVYALQAAAAVEEATGDRAMSQYWRGRAMNLGTKIREAFWSAERGLVADTRSKTCYSEHAQCLALLTEILPRADAVRCFEGLVSDKTLARATVYFSHYLFETFFKSGRPDLFWDHLSLWQDFLDQGLSTPLEAPGSRARSDCHAWGAHPLYHFLTGVAGIRPAAYGFKAVEIAPQPGGLGFIRAKMPIGDNAVSVDLTFEGNAVRGIVTIPRGITGEFVWNGERKVLNPGRNAVNR